MRFPVKKATKAISWPSSVSTLGALMAGALLLVGCQSAEPTYYGVAPVAPALNTLPRTVDPQLEVVEVRTPTIPMRLDRDTIVMSTKDYKLQLAREATWNEPPGHMIGNTLAADLERRLPGSVVFSQDDSVTTPPQAFVELNVTRFEAGPDGRAEISGVMSVRRAGILPQPACSETFQWRSTQPSSDVTQLVASLSTGMGVLADRTVTALHGLNSCPPTGSAKPVSELQQALMRAIQATTAGGMGD